MATPIMWGSEFLVNTTTLNNQRGAIVRGLADGRFVVVWHDDSAGIASARSTDVYAQVFNADGTKSGGQVLVNTTTNAIQDFPVITALADGGYVMAWDDLSLTGGDFSNTALKAQIFNVDGTRRGGEFLVNTTTLNQQEFPVIGSLADGRFVVAFTDRSVTGGDTSGTAVRAQIFNANGSKSGGEFLVNSTTANNQFATSAVGLEDGRFIICWIDISQTAPDTSSVAVRGQLYNANGTKSGNEFLLSTTTSGEQTQPIAVSLANGSFAVAFVDVSLSAPDTSGAAIRIQIFNSNGAKIGQDVVVNTTVTNAQFDPDIAALPDGRFVVAWVDASHTPPDTSADAVRAQVFNPDGTKSGQEFLVSTTYSSFQQEPSVSALADGRFVVTFSDYSLTGVDVSGAAVRGQIFDPRESAVSLVGSAAADHYVGTFLNDTMRGGAGNDRLRGEGGSDTLFGDQGSDTLHGGNGNDHVDGGADGDALFGEAGGDLLIGGSGNDTHDGGIGADHMLGGAGNDTYYVDNLQDVVDETGGSGTDRVLSSVSLSLANPVRAVGAIENLTLLGTAAIATGNASNNVIAGNGSANTLDGQLGNDTLIGLAGSDVLTGGAGRDVMAGGAENDTFRFGAASHSLVATPDLITDFDDFGNDRIDLSAVYGGVLSYRGAGAFTAIGQVRLNDIAGPDLLVQVNTGGSLAADMQIRLSATTIGSMTASDFVL